MRRSGKDTERADSEPVATCIWWKVQTGNNVRGWTSETYPTSLSWQEIHSKRLSASVQAICTTRLD